MSYTIKLHCRDGMTAATVAAWRELLDRTDPPARFTSGPEWYDRMCPASEQLVATVHDDRACLIAVLPLIPGKWRARLAGMKFNMPVYRVCGGDIVGHIPDRFAAAQLWTTILEADPKVDGVYFDKLNEDRHGEILRSGMVSGKTFLYEAYKVIPHYRLEMPADAAAAGLRSRKTMKKIAGRERALAAAAGGACRILEIRDTDSVAGYGQQAETLMRETWQAQRLGHGFRAADMSRLAQCGLLRCFMLLAGDHAAAFVFGYQDHDVYIYDKIGYAARFRDYSPGTILLYRVLDCLYRRDTPRYFDFGPGEGEYKRRLANRVTRVSGVMIVRNNPKYRCRFKLLEICRILQQSLRRLSGRFGKRIARAARRRP